MPNRSRKPKDVNQLAKSIVDRATGAVPKPEPEPPKTPEQEAAALLGRRGGLKGGPARARSLTKKRRAEIARKAAKKRWKGRRKPA